MRKMYQRTSKEKKNEIISAYLTGDNSYEELSDYYKVDASTIRCWISRYRHSGNREKAVSLQPEQQTPEYMARKKKEEKSPEVLRLEARIRELELQNLALKTLIDVAERNGIEIRKKSGAKQ